MYRQNQLLKELNRLREENEWLKNENTYLKERINRLNVEIYARNLETQVRNCSDALACRITPQPIEIKISSEQNEAFQKFLDERNKEIEK